MPNIPVGYPFPDELTALLRETGGDYCYRVLENGEVDPPGISLWDHEGFEIRYVVTGTKGAIIKYYHDEI